MNKYNERERKKEEREKKKKKERERKREKPSPFVLTPQHSVTMDSARSTIRVTSSITACHRLL
jgi:hypothetical protein